MILVLLLVALMPLPPHVATVEHYGCNVLEARTAGQTKTNWKIQAWASFTEDGKEQVEVFEAMDQPKVDPYKECQNWLKEMTKKTKGNIPLKVLPLKKGAIV